MNSLAALLVPLTLLLPLGASEAPLDENAASLNADHIVEADGKGNAPTRRAASWLQIALPFDVGPIYQVRIERRVILRVSPRPNPVRQNLMSTLPSQNRSRRFVERDMDDCVPVSGIAAVQADRGNRLLLFMRDRSLVAADLEKSCSSRHFYSGFYIESNDDGRLCIERDMLQSRSGAKCSVAEMNRLVRVEDQ